MVYLDYSATSPLLPEAKMAIVDAMELVGNASALHTPGHLAMNVIEEAREEIAKLINAEPAEILFTSGGTESNNTVTNIFARQNVAVSAIEHPSLLESAKLRCNTTIIPVDKHGLVKNSCTNASLVSVMLVNNEIGTVNDIKKLAKQAHKNGALFHTDATQALGKIKIDVKDLDIDYMTISAHKIGGPVGIGALYVKKGAPFKPLIIGGHQEKGRRAGTYQTVNIAGFGAAAKYANGHKTWEIFETKIRPLRNLLIKRILEEIPYSSSNTPAKNSLPNILNCSFEAAEGESIQLYLDAEGDIIVSTGSACASGDGKPSHVIMATRNDAEIAHSSVRFSFGLNSTEQDVDHVMKYLPNIVKRLQGISTLKAGKIKKEDSYYGKR
jgi:cysteine desulfurase